MPSNAFGNSQIECWLPRGFIFGMQQGERLGLVAGFQTFLFFGHGVLGVELSVFSPIQDVSLFHNITFLFCR